VAALDLGQRTLGEAFSRPDDNTKPRSANDARLADLADRRVRRANDLLGLVGAEIPAAGDMTEMRRALTDRLLERYERESSPAARVRFAWLIHPADLAALPPPTGGSPNDPGPEARRDAEREFAEFLVKEHLAPLAASLKAQPADAAKALAAELEKVIRDLRGYP